MNTQLHIKNMVCHRCIRVVREELEALDYNTLNVTMGEALISGVLGKEELNRIQVALEQAGFELLDDRRAQIVEKIKNTIVEEVHHSDPETQHQNISALLEKKLELEYNYISTLFSQKEGITIEKYTILQRIEKIKELLIYGEMNLSEIAYACGYSSVQHLSSQFKKTTGLTPSVFRKQGLKDRKPLDAI
ncbi:MAG: AraC family transcriptional regulator [Cyclobacteriaceae bacterium]